MDENIVLDRVTSENKSECCDFVECNNCGRVMLINHGEDTCPECDCNGNWIAQELFVDVLPDELIAEIFNEDQ